MTSFLKTALIISALAVSLNTTAQADNTKAMNGVVITELGGMVRIYQNDTVIRGRMFAFDMKRSFESGSCIAAGGILILRQPQMNWYCWNKDTASVAVGGNGYTYVEEIDVDEQRKYATKLAAE